jgi:hypothetical protein
MISSTKRSFRERLSRLPPDVRRLARKNFKLWLGNPHHPSLHFKKVGSFWSARVGSNHRALAIVTGEKAEWFWIGAHDEYERLIQQG